MGYDMFARKGDGYFRLNIWGMEAYRLHMVKTGMAFESRLPEWPNPGTYGVTWDDYRAVTYPDSTRDGQQRATLTDDTRLKVAKLAEAVQAVLRWHGEETPGIPLHKLGSNDGWIVTPVECRSAVDIWRRNGATPYGDVAEEQDYWHQWIKFLEQAADGDGFEVW